MDVCVETFLPVVSLGGTTHAVPVLLIVPIAYQCLSMQLSTTLYAQYHNIGVHNHTARCTFFVAWWLFLHDKQKGEEMGLCTGDALEATTAIALACNYWVCRQAAVG